MLTKIFNSTQEIACNSKQKVKIIDHPKKNVGKHNFQFNSDLRIRNLTS